MYKIVIIWYAYLQMYLDKIYCVFIKYTFCYFTVYFKDLYIVKTIKQ